MGDGVKRDCLPEFQNEGVQMSPLKRLDLFRSFHLDRLFLFPVFSVPLSRIPGNLVHAVKRIGISSLVEYVCR
jgi:hypothetical protein